VSEVEFRTGPREIPDYLADMMADLDTYRMTYEEAVKAANDNLVKRRIKSFADDLLVEHLRKHTGR